MNRTFRGIWIPAEIWLLEGITANEKVILMEIDSLASSNVCYASNEHFEKLCGCSESTVKRSIANLIKLNLITASYKKTKNGTTRIIKPRVKLTCVDGSICTEATGQIDPLLNTNINNNSKNGSFEPPEEEEDKFASLEEWEAGMAKLKAAIGIRGDYGCEGTDTDGDVASRTPAIAGQAASSP